MKLETLAKHLEKNLKKYAKRFWKNKNFRRICLGGFLTVIGISSLFFVFTLVYQDKIFPHTELGNFNFGGMTRIQARDFLEKLISESQDSKLRYSWKNQSYEVTTEDLEVNFDISKDETVSQMLSIGRLGPLGKILRETFRSILAKNTVLAKFSFSEVKLNDYLFDIAKNIDKPEKDASLEIRGEEVVVTQEEIGKRFEIAANKKIALEQIGSFNFPPNMPFKISEIRPKIDTPTAEAAIPETKELMSRQLMMRGANKTFPLYSKDMAGLIEFVASLNKKNVLSPSQGSLGFYALLPVISPAKVAPLVEKIAAEIYQEPKDPKFEISYGRVRAFQLSQTGYELEKEKAVSDIISAIQNGKSNLELPVKVTESAIASDDPEKIGLKELVGEGTTNFSGSPQNRRHNIAVGAESFDGVLIKPGEEFSMLKYLGPVEASTGYLPELVIKEDRTIPEYGGGLCQVSTTMFRAALNTGVKITERQNHSYRVRYYEPPVGMDATIYIPKPDFRFVNDYGSYLLIQTVISGDNLTFQFYGTRDGRRAETTEPYVYDVVGSGEPIYTESPDLAPGEIKKIESAHPGSKASFKYSVFDKDGKLRHEETFASSYVPWPARYLYGPGTEGIPAPPPEAETP